MQNQLKYPHLENRSDELSVFISHLWSDDFWYHNLTKLLDECLDYRWKNYSIPKRDDIDFSESFESWSSRIIELEEERMSSVNSRINNLKKILQSIEDELCWGIWFNAEIKADELAILSIQEDEALKIVKKAGYKYRHKSRDFLSKAQFKPDRESKIREMGEIQNEISKFHREFNLAQIQLEYLKKTEETFAGNKIISSTDYSTDNLNRDMNYGIFDRKSKRIIELEIYNRIERSDVVILIASMYSQYKSWMDYELRTAHRFWVPVIAILPENQENFPKEISMQGDNLFHWNTKQICMKLKEMLSFKKNMRRKIKT